MRGGGLCQLALRMTLTRNVLAARMTNDYDVYGVDEPHNAANYATAGSVAVTAPCGGGGGLVFSF